MAVMEKRLWKLIKDNAPGWWKRVENGVGPGTPDTFSVVYNSQQWVELKDIDRWTIKYLDVRPLQRIWLQQLHKAGGRGFVFVRVHDSEYILIRGEDCMSYAVGTKQEWCSIAVGYWERRMNWDEFARLISH